VFGDIVDRLALTQLVPVVHRRDPRARGATATSLAQRRAGGPCGPTGASVSASRSRRHLVQIQGADLMSAEHDIEAALLIGRAQRNAMMGKGAAELERAVAEAQPAALVDAPHDRCGAVVKRLDRLGKPTRARRVARRRGRQFERFVRPLGVVHHAPRIKPALALGKVGKGAPTDDLGRQGAVKPLVFARVCG